MQPKHGSNSDCLSNTQERALMVRVGRLDHRQQAQRLYCLDRETRDRSTPSSMRADVDGGFDLVSRAQIEIGGRASQ